MTSLVIISDHNANWSLNQDSKTMLVIIKRDNFLVEVKNFKKEITFEEADKMLKRAIKRNGESLYKTREPRKYDKGEN